MALSQTESSNASNLQISPRHLRGELDWIVMRALEKDPARRYDTAIGLAQDLRRFLNDQPVEAGPPARTYLLRKFARRNKAVLATVSAVLHHPE